MSHSSWVTRIGTSVVADATQAPTDAITLGLGWATPAPPGLAAYASDRAKVAELTRDFPVYR